VIADGKHHRRHEAPQHQLAHRPADHDTGIPMKVCWVLRMLRSRCRVRRRYQLVVNPR
jgi:hypothetical protein